MFITVRFLNNFSEQFDYAVPDLLKNQVQIGTLVQVPLQRRIESAIVVAIHPATKIYSFKIRPIDSIFPFPHDPSYQKCMATLAQMHQIDSFYIIKRLKNFLTQDIIESMQLPATQVHTHSVQLTDEQQAAFDAIAQDIGCNSFQPTVLHGVTGSGKTELYKKLCQAVIDKGQSALLLLPEVGLAVQFEKIFTDQMPDVEIFGFHSGTTPKQKKHLWQALLAEKPCIIIGVHLPIFLPIAHLGIIIVDEEHDAGYQEKNHPKINTKHGAILKASLSKIPIVLGSATPSIASLYQVEQKGWKFVQIKHRFSGQFPTVKIVALSDKKERKNFWISADLYQAIQQQLIKKEQTIIFINRRGYSFFVQCTTCTYIFCCQNCSVSLTLHEDGRLLCHYCNFGLITYEICPDCKGKDFLRKGIGTQQVVTILQKMFPSATIARADLDTTCKKKAWQQTLQDFYDKKIDILVGTQSITKGYHFPHVTLVGILWADVNLHFPIYNAAETTLQQLIQVAGRAGRQSESSLVIVQTMTPHLVFNYLNEIDYLQFYRSEIKKRAMVGYPPVQHIAEIEVRSNDQKTVEKDADTMVNFLLKVCDDATLVLGPVPALIYRIQKTYCQKIFLKNNNRSAMIKLFAAAQKLSLTSQLFFTIDPIN